jgi:hypothetical protein
MFFFMASILLVGCAKTYKKPFVRDDAPRVWGIEEVLAEDGVTEVDVVMIHGMCTHGRQWVQKSFNSIGKEMGFIDPESELLMVRRKDLVSARIDTDFNLISEQEQEHTAIYSHKFEKNGKALWVHAILWSPTTEPLKKKLCYDITDRGSADGKKCKDVPAFAYKRAKWYTGFKDKLMNNCLSDVFIYLGEKQKEIQKQVASAIVYAAGIRATLSASDTATVLSAQGWGPIIDQARNETAPVFIIAESMGCKVLFDTLIAMFAESIGEGDLIESSDEALKAMLLPSGKDDAPLVQAVKKFFQRTQQVYMGGNQIPVLSLANESNLWQLVKVTSSTKGDSRAHLTVENPMSVAVFSDPNDILSYTFEDSGFDEIEWIQAVDVVVSNYKTWFDRFEWPLLSHGGYRENPQVQNIIRCGYPEWADCPERIID